MPTATPFTLTVAAASVVVGVTVVAVVRKPYRCGINEPVRLKYLVKIACREGKIGKRGDTARRIDAVTSTSPASPAAAARQ